MTLPRLGVAMSNKHPSQPQTTVTGKLADIGINTPTHKANESLNLQPTLTVLDFETLTENIGYELEHLFYLLTLAVSHANYDQLQAVAEITLKTVTALRSELDETTSKLLTMRRGEKWSNIT